VSVRIEFGTWAECDVSMKHAEGRDKRCLNIFFVVLLWSSLHLWSVLRSSLYLCSVL
jgi:hypothetical protein